LASNNRLQRTVCCAPPLMLSVGRAVAQYQVAHLLQQQGCGALVGEGPAQAAQGQSARQHADYAVN